MHGTFTYIWVILRTNIKQHSIHGAYGHHIIIYVSWGQRSAPRVGQPWHWRHRHVSVAPAAADPGVSRGPLGGADRQRRHAPSRLGLRASWDAAEVMGSDVWTDYIVILVCHPMAKKRKLNSKATVYSQWNILWKIHKDPMIDWDQDFQDFFQLLGFDRPCGQIKFNPFCQPVAIS